jgi:hypothetical protein
MTDYRSLSLCRGHANHPGDIHRAAVVRDMET